MHSDLPSLDQHCGYAREIFSVEEERVILDAQQGWGCSCATYAEHGQCLHVEKAQSFRNMRGVRREDDTIEFQLNAAQLQELSQAEETEVLPAKATALPPRLRRHSPWTTVAVATAMSAVSSGITYLAIARAPSRAAEPTALSTALAAYPMPQADAPHEVQVTFVNPFDATEVFMFPAGTSQTDARDAVAELLLNRARERDASERARLERSMSLADAG